MAEDRYLDKAQARDTEEELFATRRQQASRHMLTSHHLEQLKQFQNHQHYWQC